MKNKIKRYEYTKQWKKNHKKYVSDYNKQYAIKNKDKIKIRMKKNHKRYYQLNKEKILEKNRNYYLKNKLHIKMNMKKYYLKNKKKFINYYNQRKKTNMSYRILCNLRTRIWLALKGNPKISTTMNLVGCHIDLLRLHLQSKFQPGMSFSNYGKWHIDHIIPCARFNLSKVSEQKKCFHYTNLQPLWAKENQSKNCKIINLTNTK